MEPSESDRRELTAQLRTLRLELEELVKELRVRKWHAFLDEHPELDNLDHADDDA